jgi:Protein of unknown function (DUF2721)
MAIADNPFATLTILVAPAILTNASSVLCLGTGNRIARVVDRTRALAAELAKLDRDHALRVPYDRQMARLKERAHLLLRALRLFYTSIGSFAAAALVAIIGSVLAGAAGNTALRGLEALGLIAGSVGVGGLVFGCVLMVSETRIAVGFLEEEAGLLEATADPVETV